MNFFYKEFSSISKKAHTYEAHLPFLFHIVLRSTLELETRWKKRCSLNFSFSRTLFEGLRERVTLEAEDECLCWEASSGTSSARGTPQTYAVNKTHEISQNLTIPLFCLVYVYILERKRDWPTGSPTHILRVYV